MLPRDIAFCFQNFDYSITNWLPFYWKGFKQTTRYTYVINNLHDIDDVYSNFSSKTKGKIKKASKLVKCCLCDDLCEFYNINKMVFDRQGIKIPYSLQFLRRLDNTLMRYNRRKILIAKDDNENIHAAIYIIWDEESAYNLMIGGNPNFRNSDATSLLVWEAIKFASSVTKKFDFEGSMLESVEGFFRGFDAKQKRYFSVYKVYDRKLAILMKCKEIVNIMRRR